MPNSEVVKKEQMSEQLFICCGCILSGEVYVGKEEFFCEVCNCKEPFTTERINEILKALLDKATVDEQRKKNDTLSKR